jgi:CDP-diglyceride synthetase
MKLNSRFFASWILGSILMYALFYTWHGVFLNDFKKISFPFTWLIIFTSIAYITISFVLYAVYESKPMKNVYNFFFRGILSGALVGFIIFVISTVVTISISRNLSAEHLMLDCVWQMTEQTIGGILLAVVKVFVADHRHEEA